MIFDSIIYWERLLSFASNRPLCEENSDNKNAFHLVNKARYHADHGNTQNPLAGLLLRHLLQTFYLGFQVLIEALKSNLRLRRPREG